MKLYKKNQLLYDEANGLYYRLKRDHTGGGWICTEHHITRGGNLSRPHEGEFILTTFELSKMK